MTKATASPTAFRIVISMVASMRPPVAGAALAGGRRQD
jgi:hypothetical protein